MQTKDKFDGPIFGEELYLRGKHFNLQSGKLASFLIPLSFADFLISKSQIVCIMSQPTTACSKPAIETQEQDVKYVQGNNKDTKFNNKVNN